MLRHYLNQEPLAWHGGGVAPKLSHTEALVAADCLERGTGREQAAYILSKRRADKGIYRKDGEAKVSAKAIRTAFKGLGGVTNRRGTTCTGSRDVDSAWATSSLAQCTQFDEEIIMPTCTQPQEEATLDHAWQFKVQGAHKVTTVNSLLKDPLELLGNDVLIKPYGDWWPGQPDAVNKKQWPSLVVGFTEQYEYPAREIACRDRVSAHCEHAGCVVGLVGVCWASCKCHRAFWGSWDSVKGNKRNRKKRGGFMGPLPL